MKIAVFIGVFAALAAAAALVFIYSGVYDIAATTPHFTVTHRVLTTVKE